MVSVRETRHIFLYIAVQCLAKHLLLTWINLYFSVFFFYRRFSLVMFFTQHLFGRTVFLLLRTMDCVQKKIVRLSVGECDGHTVLLDRKYNLQQARHKYTVQQIWHRRGLNNTTSTTVMVIALEIGRHHLLMFTGHRAAVHHGTKYWNGCNILSVRFLDTINVLCYGNGFTASCPHTQTGSV